MSRYLMVLFILTTLFLPYVDAQSSDDTSPPFSTDRPGFGPPDATVQVEIFNDFTCPYCARFAQEILPTLLAEYGDRVHFVFHNFAILEDKSIEAAAAAECAFQQDAFWEMHDWLFANIDRFDRDVALEAAKAFGLSVPNFSTCLDDLETLLAITEDIRLGIEREITGVPTIFINDTVIVGSQPVETFTQAIETALGQTPTTSDPVSDAVERYLTASQSYLDGTQHRELSTEMHELIDEMGYPDAFSMTEIDDVNGQPMTYETWTYYRGNTLFVFIDGQYIRDEYVDYPEGGVTAARFTPEQFVMGISRQDLMDTFQAPLDWRIFTTASLDDMGAEIWIGESIIASFQHDRLIGVEVLAIENAEEGN